VGAAGSEQPDRDVPRADFDAVCDPIRRLFPTVLGGIDFAPFIAMLAIWFIQLFAVRSLHDIAIRM
jgi:uncharacterized protein YggT (Ycf19 family)